MPLGLISTQDQLAAFRDASDSGVALVHVDTCLSSYVQDHHNRDGEALFGVYVDGNATRQNIRDDLELDFRSTERVPSYVPDAAIAAALDALFDGLDLNDLFDASLEVPETDEDGDPLDDDMGESCQAWFVLTWVHKPYVAWDIHNASGHLVHNVIVTDEERAQYLSDYDDGTHVWTETGRYSEDEAEDMSYTDRGLAHLDEGETPSG